MIQWKRMESMTKYERRELSHNWEDIRPLLKDTAQITYEIIRPIRYLASGWFTSLVNDVGRYDFFRLLRLHSLSW